MTEEILKWINLLIIPLFIYIVKVEKRLTCIKTKVDVLYEIWNKKSK